MSASSCSICFWRACLRCCIMGIIVLRKLSHRLTKPLTHCSLVQQLLPQQLLLLLQQLLQLLLQQLLQLLQHPFCSASPSISVYPRSSVLCSLWPPVSFYVDTTVFKAGLSSSSESSALACFEVLSVFCCAGSSISEQIVYTNEFSFIPTSNCSDAVWQS